MKITPYSKLPDYCFWKKSVSNISANELDPVVSVPFYITKEDKVATAGSCFAQHIARYLRNLNFNFLITEPAHAILSEEEATAYNYGTFTARYGNVYTTRQLLQLFKRAYGTFIPKETVWQDSNGQYIDLFRPQIQPNGFSSKAEFDCDQKQHFAAVREAFESLDIFVFTLCLTEGWEAIADGSIFPLCPGVAGGEFDSNKYRLHNFNTAEVISDMIAFIELLKSVNKKVKIILTVSPVPLIATALIDKHVLTATTYSKSVLRVACEEIAQQCEQVCYFPSYEIITGNYSRGNYFAADCRSVNELGVSHVMRVFLKHFTQTELKIYTSEALNIVNQHKKSHLQEMEEIVRVNCDEEAISNSFQEIENEKAISTKDKKNIFDSGVLFIKQGRYDLASLEFNKLLNIEPFNDSALVQLGVCKKRLGLRKEAELAFDCAININAKNIGALTELGRLLFEDSNVIKAKKTFILLLDSNPNHKEALLYFARILYVEKDNVGALNAIEKLLNLDVSNQSAIDLHNKILAAINVTAQ